MTKPEIHIKTESGYNFTVFKAYNVDHLIGLFPDVISLCEDYKQSDNGLVYIYMDYKTVKSLPSRHTQYFVDGEEVDMLYWGKSLYEDNVDCTLEHYWEYPDNRLKPYIGDNSHPRLILTCGEFSEEEFSARVEILEDIAKRCISPSVGKCFVGKEG